MSELPPNHDNKDQLPLYGLVYNPEAKEYEQTLGGVAVLMAVQPTLIRAPLEVPKPVEELVLS